MEGRGGNQPLLGSSSLSGTARGSSNAGGKRNGTDGVDDDFDLHRLV
jgi:hypothetical protein